MAEALKWQKKRMMMDFHGNAERHHQHNEAESENDTGLSEFPFMVMPHPLLPAGLPPASVAMVINQMSELNSLANMAAVSHVQREDGKECPPRSPSLSDEELHPQEASSQSASRASSLSLSSPPADLESPERENHSVKMKEKGNLNALPADSQMLLPLLKLTNEKLSISHADPAFAPLLLDDGLSSMETLLTNIEGLLKVALESVRCQDQQSRLERKELNLELERQRDVRQTLQRHLSSELHSTVSIQRRLKKEKKAKRRLQEALDFESRRREQLEKGMTDVMPDSELENQQQNSAAQ